MGLMILASYFDGFSEGESSGKTYALKPVIRIRNQGEKLESKNTNSGYLYLNMI